VCTIIGKHMKARRVTLVLLLVLIISSCSKEVENPYYTLLVDKEWVSEVNFPYSYVFSSNKECRIVNRYYVLNTEANELTEVYDTLYRCWNLHNDIIIINSCSKFYVPEIDQFDLKIIELTENTFKYKYLMDVNNPYVLPYIYRFD
jgi:hypothetical protein